MRGNCLFFPQLFIETFFHRSLIQTPTVAFISIHNQVIIYFCHPSITFHCFSCLQCHGGHQRPYGEGRGGGLTPCTSCQFIKWKHVSQFAWCDSRLQTGGSLRSSLPDKNKKNTSREDWRRSQIVLLIRGWRNIKSIVQIHHPTISSCNDMTLFNCTALLDE